MLNFIVSITCNLKRIYYLLAQASVTGVVMQTRSSWYPYHVQPQRNWYNLFKMVEVLVFRNYNDYVTDPAVVQQHSIIMDIQLKQQVLGSRSTTRSITSLYDIWCSTLHNIY